MSLKNRVAIVTGGIQGNGFGIVEALLDKGAKVAIFDMNDPGEVVEKLKSQGHDVIGFQADVTDKTMLKECTKGTFDHYGRIDILVNNAGILIYRPFVEFTDEERDKQFNVNINGAWNTSQCVVPYMIEAGYGRIVSVGSITGGYVGDAESIGYGTSKAAVTGFTKCLAVELADKGITCNVICPGFIHTNMVDSMANEMNPDNPQTVLDEFSKSLPVGRLGKPREIGELVAYLVSDEAAFVTGAEVVIDGGCVLPESKIL